MEWLKHIIKIKSAFEDSVKSIIGALVVVAYSYDQKVDWSIASLASDPYLNELVYFYLKG